MNEEWRDIPGYEGFYQASNKGRIKSRKTGKILKPSITCYGYSQVTLCKNRNKKNFRNGRLIAKVFIPNPDDKPQINHKNGIKTNDYTKNLEWVTEKQNTIHAHSIGLIDNRGEKHQMVKLTESQVRRIKFIYKYYGKQKKGYWKQLVISLNISKSAIDFIKSGRNWKHIII